jgi:hypothetical protein
MATVTPDSSGTPSKNADSVGSDDLVRDILEGYRSDADMYAAHHDAATRYYSFVDKFFSLPCKVLPFIATTLMATKFGGSELGGTWNLQYAASIATGVTGMLTIIRSQMQLETRSVMHKTACLSSGELRREVSFFLARTHESAALDAFVKIADNKVTAILKTSPPVPGWIMSRVDRDLDDSVHKKHIIHRVLRTQAAGHRYQQSKAVTKRLLNMSTGDLRKLTDQRKVPDRTHIHMQRKRVSDHPNDTKHRDLLETAMLDCSITEQDLHALGKPNKLASQEHELHSEHKDAEVENIANRLDLEGLN